MRLLKLLYLTAISPILDTIFPPICALCECLLPQSRKIVCSKCIDTLPASQNDVSLPLNNKSFDSLYILYEFDEKIRQLIHMLKYKHCKILAHYLVEHAQKTRYFRKNYDYIIPVPLHRVKLRERGYNQSAELAQQLALLSGIPYTATVLDRTRYTPSQTQFSIEERLHNVADAFRCSIDLHNKSILLVDDVVTTGSTVEACAGILKIAHARCVDVFALANPTLHESQKKT